MRAVYCHLFQEETGGQDVWDAMASSRLIWRTPRHAKDASRPLARERTQSPFYHSRWARDWNWGSCRVHHVNDKTILLKSTYGEKVALSSTVVPNSHSVYEVGRFQPTTDMPRLDQTVINSLTKWVPVKPLNLCHK